MFLTCGISLFGFMACSSIVSLGIAVLLVERGESWPVSIFKNFILRILGKIHSKMPEMLECSICTSFWAALFADAFLFLITGGCYFAWPLSGFFAVSFVWFINEFLNAVDRKE